MLVFLVLNMHSFAHPSLVLQSLRQGLFFYIPQAYSALHTGIDWGVCVCVFFC